MAKKAAKKAGKARKPAKKPAKKAAKKSVKKSAKKPAKKKSAPAAKKSKKPAKVKKVKIYTTPTCPYCSMAKDLLDDLGVGYEEIDVSADESAAEEMIEKSGQMGVPVIEVGNTIIVGYDRESIKKELGK